MQRPAFCSQLFLAATDIASFSQRRSFMMTAINRAKITTNETETDFPASRHGAFLSAPCWNLALRLVLAWVEKQKDEREKKTSHILACAGTCCAMLHSILYVVAVAHAPRIACKMLVLPQHICFDYGTSTCKHPALCLREAWREARLRVLDIWATFTLLALVLVRVRACRILLEPHVLFQGPDPRAALLGCGKLQHKRRCACGLLVLYQYQSQGASRAV
ncbi:hypothetical protein J3F84DRAFT_196976 [Trichoderma pleuroticola]